MSMKQELLAEGYIGYGVCHFKEVPLYQKLIKDCEGRRYFINCYEYEHKDLLAYEFDVQYKLGEDSAVVNVSLTSATLGEAEDFFHEMWVRMGFGYYELYEEE